MKAIAFISKPRVCSYYINKMIKNFGGRKVKRFVRYNGGTKSYYGCTKPTELIKGKIYEVTNDDDRGSQTDYTLKGVEGYFNSCWFDEVKNTYVAIANEKPIRGTKCRLAKIEAIDGEHRLRNVTTSTVKEVNEIGNNVYEVVTCNSVYFVQV